MSVNLPNIDWIDENIEPTSDLKKGLLCDIPTIVNASLVHDIDDSTSILAPLHQDLVYLYFDEARRNSYSNYPTPQEIRSKELENHNQALASGIPSYSPSLEWQIPYMQTQAYKRSHEILETWLKTDPISGAVLPNHEIEKYVPKPIPRDIRDMLNRPKLNFEKLRQILDEPSEDIGFYSYKGILVMCKHIFMYYSGENGREIYRACGDGSGVCKYCGASLPIDIYDNNDQLETHHLAILFEFIDSLGSTIDPSVILRILTGAVSKSIDKLKLTLDNEVCGFIACYLYKLDKDLASFDKKRYKKSELEKIYAEEWSLNKWRREDVEKTIENNEIFCDYVFVLNYLKSILEKSETREPSTPIEVLYANPNSPLIKLYEKDPSIFSSMNELVRLKSLDGVGTNLVYPPSFIINYPTPLKIEGLNKLIDFLKKWGEVVCPAGGIHKLPCSRCGLKKDLSNVEEVAAKFENSINRSSDSIWHKFNQKDERGKFVEKIKNSSSNKPARITDIDILLTDSHRKKVRELLIQIIGIGEISELSESQEDVCKLLNYVIENNVIDFDWLVNQLQTIYQTVPPITFAKLFTSM